MNLLFVPILLLSFISLSLSYSDSSLIFQDYGDHTLDNLPDLSGLDILLKPLDAIHTVGEKLGLKKSRVPSGEYKLNKTDCFCSEKEAEKSSTASEVVILFLNDPKCRALVINNLFLLTKASCVDENQSNFQKALVISEQKKYAIDNIYKSGDIAIVQLIYELPLAKNKLEPICLDVEVKKAYEKSKKWIKKIVGADNYCVQHKHKFFG